MGEEQGQACRVKEKENKKEQEEGQGGQAALYRSRKEDPGDGAAPQHGWQRGPTSPQWPKGESSAGGPAYADAESAEAARVAAAALSVRATQAFLAAVMALESGGTRPRIAPLRSTAAAASSLRSQLRPAKSLI
jgi:hypothetical protein